MSTPLKDDMTISQARTMVEKTLTVNKEVSAVTIIGETVVQVHVNFEKMTSFTNRRLEIAQQMLGRYGFGLALCPTGISIVIGLPDKTSPHLVPGPPPFGFGMGSC
jgi:hypothetical protein